ncbi:MAG: hypothetical protein ACI9W2_003164 [Gammaproteobacteria bacterium]
MDGVIVPAYRNHARAGALLPPVLKAHCAGLAERAAVLSAFRALTDAWQQAWPITFGPVANGPGVARIAFWPDRRGSGARQRRALLVSLDESVLHPGALVGKSVAIGDLHALERLLFDESFDDYRCSLALAIAGARNLESARAPPRFERLFQDYAGVYRILRVRADNRGLTPARGDGEPMAHRYSAVDSDRRDPRCVRHCTPQCT